MDDSFISIHLTWKVPLNKHYTSTAEWFWVVTDNARNDITKPARQAHR
jgi:hypothetical protein